MLSQTAEYALRAMWFLARNKEQPQVIPNIATATEVSRDYLYKVLQQLVRGRLVRSRRGKGGGYILARNPETVTLFDIVNAVSPLQRFNHCPLTNRAYSANHESGGPGMCPLHAAMDDAAHQFETRLNAMRLSDLLKRVRTFPVAVSWPTGPAVRLTGRRTKVRAARNKTSTPERRVRRQALRSSAG